MVEEKKECEVIEVICKLSKEASFSDIRVIIDALDDTYNDLSESIYLGSNDVGEIIIYKKM